MNLKTGIRQLLITIAVAMKNIFKPIPMCISDIDPATNAYWIANGMESKRYEYDLTCEDVVLDLGCYQGEFAEKIHEKYGCQVICVEPTDAANHLEKYPWATVVNAAASVDNIPMKFGGAFYYTSLFEPGDQIYPCFDVLELLVDQKFGLVKINIEGMEMVVLPRIIESGLIKNIKYLLVQFHKVNDRAELNYAYIAKDLMKTHELMWRVPFCWESWKLKQQT